MGRDVLDWWQFGASFEDWPLEPLLGRYLPNRRCAGLSIVVLGSTNAWDRDWTFHKHGLWPTVWCLSWSMVSEFWDWRVCPFSVSVSSRIWRGEGNTQLSAKGRSQDGRKSEKKPGDLIKYITGKHCMAFNFQNSFIAMVGTPIYSMRCNATTNHFRSYATLRSNPVLATD